MINKAEQRHNKEKIEKKFEKIKLFKWQTLLFKKLEETPDDRKIIWYVDPEGCHGKTTCCKMLVAQKKALYAQNCAMADIARAYKGQNIVVFDFTRDKDGIINYGAIEQIKNGIIFSAKYDSEAKVYENPHVICFSNFEPRKNAFTEDRWEIHHLTDDDCTTEPTLEEMGIDSTDLLEQVNPIGSDTNPRTLASLEPADSPPTFASLEPVGEPGPMPLASLGQGPRESGNTATYSEPYVAIADSLPTDNIAGPCGSFEIISKYEEIEKPNAEYEVKIPKILGSEKYGKTRILRNKKKVDIP